MLASKAFGEVPSGGVSDAIWLGWGSCGVCHQQMIIIFSDITCGRKFSLMEVLYEESWREPGTMERMEEGTRLSSGGMAPSQGGVWGGTRQGWVWGYDEAPHLGGSRVESNEQARAILSHLLIPPPLISLPSNPRPASLVLLCSWLAFSHCIVNCTLVPKTWHTVYYTEC